MAMEPWTSLYFDPKASPFQHHLVTETALTKHKLLTKTASYTCLYTLTPLTSDAEAPERKEQSLNHQTQPLDHSLKCNMFWQILWTRREQEVLSFLIEKTDFVQSLPCEMEKSASRRTRIKLKRISWLKLVVSSLQNSQPDDVLQRA